MEEVPVAKVAVAAATYAIDKPYDYQIPRPMCGQVQPGVRVTAPFGRGDRPTEGVVLSVGTAVKNPRLKYLSTVLDASPVLDEEGLRLAYWMRERYFCTLFEAVRAILPVGLWYRIQEYWHILPDQPAEELLSGRKRALEVWQTMVRQGGSIDLETLKELCGDGVPAVLHHLESLELVYREVNTTRKIQDKVATRLRLAIPLEEARALLDTPLGCKREAVLRLLCDTGSGLVSEICYCTGASRQTVRSLVRDGICAEEEEEAFRVPHPEAAGEGTPIVLNEEQEKAFSGILAAFRSGEPTCSLLYGVTGSGKTLVYIRLLQEVVASGRQGIILVPEIALTPQMMEKFSAYFGEKVVMLHSSLKMSERYDQWKRIRRGEVDIVLGTRSAVFAPLERLGMMILDEEQEGSYQSENLPRYHARDVAKFRCSRMKAALVLGSATPTVDSAFQAKQGRYRLFALKNRYNARSLPQVIVADLREELRAGNGGAVSRCLRTELEKNIRAGEQSILFLNRRGSSPKVICVECGHVPYCPHCSVPLTYHSANERLMCHYCGYSAPYTGVCEACACATRPMGAGTQRVEEELSQLFPGVRVLRMDADTASGRHEQLLRTFDQEKVPILLGTQMVAKGLDFENVTLVGVLSADLSLYVDHYAAAERTFSLLTQVVGRAGRGGKPGRAVIQTYTPDNDVITCAARQDYRDFLRSELRLRQMRRNPPFADIFTLTVSGREEQAVIRSIRALHGAIRSAPNLRGELVGPAPAPILRLNESYRYRMFLVGCNDHATRLLLGYYLKSFQEQKENRHMRLTIDCGIIG